MKNKTQRIPNLITYIPVSMNDILLGGVAVFYASRLLNLGMGALPNDILPYANQIINWYLPHYSNLLASTTFAGMALSGATDMLLKPKIPHKEDVSEKLGVKRNPVDEKTRKDKINELCLEISDDYTEETYSMKQEAETANKNLEEIIYKIEGVRVKTSSKIKKSHITKYIMPHAIEGCNIISKDIEIYKQLPYVSFSMAAHELAHRKTYTKENDAEVLAHLAGFAAKDKVFIQSSKISRLRRECQTLFKKYDKVEKEKRKQLDKEYKDFLNRLRLPEKIKGFMIESEFQKYNIITEGIKKGQIAIYDVLMKVLGQKEGPSRYTKVFTEDLYALEKKYSSIENLVKTLSYESFLN